MDIFFGVENTPTYPRNIPNVEMFEMNVRGSAVNSRDHVVIYENTGRYGFFLGARTWWMFKVIIRRYSCHCTVTTIIITRGGLPYETDGDAHRKFLI